MVAVFIFLAAHVNFDIISDSRVLIDYRSPDMAVFTDTDIGDFAAAVAFTLIGVLVKIRSHHHNAV